MATPVTFESSQHRYINRTGLKSVHTLAAYSRSIDLFFAFLADRTQKNLLPIQTRQYTTPQQLQPSELTADDRPILLRFAEWLLSSGDGKDRRPYALATVELRLAGVQHWFQFMKEQGWLSSDFSLEQASQLVRDMLKVQHSDNTKAVLPAENLEPVIYYYDTQPTPKSMLKAGTDSERFIRWELTRLRNCALLHSLAESGGRISELLSMDVQQLSETLQKRSQEVVEIEVMGKGGHPYQLRLKESLPMIRAYVQQRYHHQEMSGGYVPLFVSHDPRYDGSRMSRIVAWRVVRRAARALGMNEVSPHDFRHWRAMQLIRAGHPLHEVQDILGHRSIETVRTLYAHLESEKGRH